MRKELDQDTVIDNLIEVNSSMSDENFLKSWAFIIHTEWGQGARLPREERIADHFPEIPAAEREEWLREFKQIESFMYDLANDGKATDYSQAEFAALLRKEHPFMDDSAVSRAHWLACYSQWHG